MNLRRVLIKGGTVISVDPEIGDLPKGDVLFEGGKISEVAPDVKARTPRRLTRPTRS